MNAFAVLVVNEHLTQLRLEAAQRRATQVDKPSLRQRIASAAASASHRLSMPIDNRGTMIPSLQDYPYRG